MFQNDPFFPLGNETSCTNGRNKEQKNPRSLLRGVVSQKEHDVVVHTDKGIDVLLDSREPFLDGVFIQYFFVGKSGFIITNSSKGNHGDH